MLDTLDLDLNDILLSLSNALNLVLSPADFAFADHNHRVAYIAVNLADLLPDSEIDRNELCLAALLHDAGIFSDKEKAKLKEIDWEGAWQHCEGGYELLKRFPRFTNLPSVVRFHHDK